MTALKIITIILFVLITIVTVQLHPEMHQPMLLESADFKVVRESDYLLDKNKMPITSTTATSKEINVKVTEPSTTQTKYIQTNTTPIREKEQIVYNPPSPKRTQNKNNDDTMDQLELLENIINQIQEQPTETPKPTPPQPTSRHIQQPPKVQQPKSNPKNPYMTEQEEIIAWNKWRSDLQNRIMIDSKIDYAPIGTMFLFSCVIDKFGNVSNIKTWSSNSDFTSVAKNKIKPAIANMQGQPILRFPRGTQRSSTVFNGAFLIGIEDRYSTPSDYADFERVMRNGN